MSNFYRLLIAVYSAEQRPVKNFIGALITGGWKTVVPLTHKQDLLLTSSWTDAIGDQIRVVSQSGLSESGRSFVSQSDVCDLRARDCRMDFTELTRSPEPYEGLVVPSASSTVAIVVSECYDRIPGSWIARTIRTYYPDGLRFFVRAYDICEMSQADWPRNYVFYSVGNEPYPFKRSSHVVGIEERVQSEASWK